MNMKIIKKIQVILIILIALVIGGTVKSFASDNATCKLDISSDKYEIEQGEKVKFTINISDIEANGGISAFTAGLKYNKEVFDVNVTTVNRWTEMHEQNVYNFFAPGYEPVVKDQKVAEVEISAKDDAKIGKQKIELFYNEISSEGKTYVIPSFEREIEIVEKGTDTGDNENNENNGNNGDNGSNAGGDNSNESKPDDKDDEESKDQDSNESKLPLPDAGMITGTVIVAIIIALGIAVVAYARYKKIH